MMPALSIDEQIAAMTQTWPQFARRHVDRRNQSARWIGNVKPQLWGYKIEIRYQRGSLPEVRVLSPALVRLPDNEEGQLPHVYPPADDPRLCLFDPRTDEWKPSMPIAQTILPWSIDWLTCYEYWLMTKKWNGGGTHADSPPASQFMERAQ